jgi:hypothetical protein
MTPADPSSSALRFLLPSVRDIIFIFLFWSVLAGPLSNRPLADPDIGWHIRSGEQILATHSLPRTDPFSSTMQGQPWFAWEWLYELLLGILHQACGLNGVVWLCALLVAAIFALLLLLLLQRGTGLLMAVVLMLLAEAASMIHLYARPHIVSWLFSLLWFAALDRWESSEQRERPWARSESRVRIRARLQACHRQPIKMRASAPEGTPEDRTRPPNVILSGVAASRSEAATQSKDPYPRDTSKKV